MRFFHGLQWLLLPVVLATAPLSQDEQRLSRELAPLLSHGAALRFPSSSDWDTLTARASYPRISPGYIAAVEVATEEDVANTIKVANKQGLPFLAVSGTHGWVSSLDQLQHGIQINMRKLNSTHVNGKKKTATVGGGSLQYEATAALLEQGKQAVTGLCECVSFIGPALGGGHSMLQGVHGFAADNIVSARLVLGDGRVVTVSEDSNPDLLWAVRGAGHNFGIVTSVEVNAYDVAKSGWSMTALSFTQDKLEAFFNTWNKVEDEHENPGLLVLNGLMARNAQLDAKHPVINLQLFWEGDNTVIASYLRAFRALKPASDTTETNIQWGNDLYTAGGFDTTSPVCRKNANILGSPNSFPRWDAAAMRLGFNLFSELTAEDTFSTSAWLLESYGRTGVRAVPESTNAVAPEERAFHLLSSTMLWWDGDDTGTRRKAEAYGAKIQEAVRTAQYKPHTYVNYASGGESLAEVYGRDATRLQRLKQLKAKWDPQNRFGFYNPISRS